MLHTSETTVVLVCRQRPMAVRRIVAVLVAVASMAFSFAARADDAAVDRAAGQLKESDDFRVRTQAALSLGASKSQRAIEPLCSGLEDSNITVRAAAAAALGKLKKGGEDCLEKRLEDESNGTVKSSIKKALAILKGASEPAITEKTKVYLAIAKPTDKTGRSGDGVVKLVRSAMVKAAGGEDGFVVAPADETSTQAKTRISKFKSLRAFYLSPKVLEPKYSGGTLQIKVEVAIFTYPGKALKGSIPIRLTQEGVSDKDSSAEDDLIKMAVERAIQKFSQSLERIQ